MCTKENVQRTFLKCAFSSCQTKVTGYGPRVRGLNIALRTLVIETPSSVQLGNIQRRLAWPLHKDDTLKSRMYSLFPPVNFRSSLASASTSPVTGPLNALMTTCSAFPTQTQHAPKKGCFSHRVSGKVGEETGFFPQNGLASR